MQVAAASGCCRSAWRAWLNVVSVLAVQCSHHTGKVRYAGKPCRLGNKNVLRVRTVYSRYAPHAVNAVALKRRDLPQLHGGRAQRFFHEEERGAIHSYLLRDLTHGHGPEDRMLGCA